MSVEIKNKEQLLNLVGAYVAGEARKNVAKAGHKYSWGTLENSITYWLEGDDTICIGTKLDYAPYIEFGTGLFAEGGKGRKDVPWVYPVEGSLRKLPEEKETPKQPAPHRSPTKKPESAKKEKKETEKNIHFFTTYGQNPQPFLRPALRDNKDKILQLIRNKMEFHINDKY